MRARVPASSANLGPGFDSLAVALTLYVEVEVHEADSFSITTSGEGAGRFDDPSHLAARLIRDLWGHDRFALHVHSEIPLSRGLGSSAALAVAAAAAARAPSPLAVGTAVDGHAENAAASVEGGLVVAGLDGDDIVVRQLPLDDEWRFVVVIPDRELATADARAVLPAAVPFGDAVHNLNALGLLIAGLADHRQFHASAMQDFLHQPYRNALLAFAPPLLALLREAGALGSCWSGAGSTMLGLTTASTADTVARAARSFLDERGEPGTVHVLDADRRGVVTA